MTNLDNGEHEPRQQNTPLSGELVADDILGTQMHPEAQAHDQRTDAKTKSVNGTAAIILGYVANHGNPHALQAKQNFEDKQREKGIDFTIDHMARTLYSRLRNPENYNTRKSIEAMYTITRAAHLMAEESFTFRQYEADRVELEATAEPIDKVEGALSDLRQADSIPQATADFITEIHDGLIANYLPRQDQ